MPNVKCKVCKKSFYIKPNRQKRGWGKFCSRKCMSIRMHNGSEFRCSACGRKLYRTKLQIKRSRINKFFCNKSCFAVWKNKNIFYGDKHGNWKGSSNVYRSIMLRNKIRAVCSKCGITDIKVLVVHHIDQNRKNNNIDNLVWLCRNCHYLAHKGKTF